MGCDIHAYAEVKINGVWHLYSHPRLQRDYNLFSRMANVRNSERNIKPISAPRGLPQDVSFMTRFCRDYYGSDGHSDSWLSGEEVDALVSWKDALDKKRDNAEYASFEHRELGYIFGNGWNVKKYPSSYPPEVEDARLVFWFDN